MTNERIGGNQTDQPPKPGEPGYEADQEEQDNQDRGGNNPVAPEEKGQTDTR